jgi:hypothetical protein
MGTFLAFIVTFFSRSWEVAEENEHNMKKISNAALMRHVLPDGTTTLFRAAGIA